MSFHPPEPLEWEKLFPFPSKAQILAHNRRSTPRSPYLCGWLHLPQGVRYKEFRISFKADHLPKGTYCCMGCWTMDHTPLIQRGLQLRTEAASCNAYAGFQNLHDGSKVSIMSFWDVFYKKGQQSEQCLRAKRVFPVAASQNETFGNEGTGAHRSVSYPWEAGHWYRMHLRCIRSAETGCTLVEQWVRDLETNEDTLLCMYDSGVPESAFCGSIAVFLENYLTDHAGDVRSLEFCDASYLPESTGVWTPFNSVHILPQGGYPAYEGSYRFGVRDGLTWMITSGVGGDWYTNQKGQPGTTFPLPEE